MRKALVTLFAVLGLLVAPGAASAHHALRVPGGGILHWARTSNPFTVYVSDQTRGYGTFISRAESDWSKSGVLDLLGGKGARQDTVYNANYGATGWIGLATIWYDSNFHIQKAEVQLNDYYFNQSFYNSDAWRQFVTCQELGHTLGLDHQNSSFYNKNRGTCMDYTPDPDGGGFYGLSNLSPNQHDYDELDTVYSHLDSSNTAGARAGVFKKKTYVLRIQ